MLEKSLSLGYCARALKFMPCVFVAVGKRRSEVLRLQKVLQAYNAMYFTTILFTGSEDLAGVQHFAPYAGCAVAE